MARDNPVRESANELPNLVTIVGRGVPSAYEVTVAGDIEMDGTEATSEGTVVSGSAAEGSIDAGVHRFRFSGQMANVELVDWNGVPAPDSPSTPTVHVDYGASTR